MSSMERVQSRPWRWRTLLALRARPLAGARLQLLVLPQALLLLPMFPLLLPLKRRKNH